ncbi:MAG: ISAs1 family transposase [Cyanobacteria bacterium P01_B01_bin.77]
MGIIVASGNNYVMTVKKNQPKLYEAIAAAFDQGVPASGVCEQDRSHGRDITRTVSVLPLPSTIDSAWVGLASVIKVERVGRRGHTPFSETLFYISSLNADAMTLAQRIRHHWHVENRLHWPKDVVFKEDHVPVCDGHAITNFGILRTIAINLFRRHGFDSITHDIRLLAHDVETLFSFFQ